MSNLKNQIWKSTNYLITKEGVLICTSIKKQGLKIETALFCEYLKN